jgi:CRP/FNR family transcriptional regulator, cyclic AMP receptor protein
LNTLAGWTPNASAASDPNDGADGSWSYSWVRKVIRPPTRTAIAGVDPFTAVIVPRRRRVLGSSSRPAPTGGSDLSQSGERGQTGVVRPVHDLLAGLVRSYLFEGLTPDDIAPLAATATTRALVRDERLCHMGDPADEIWVVLSGEVKDSVVDAEGYEVIHFVHGPGMTLGEPGFFSVERTRIVEVIAVESSTLIRLDRRDLAPFMDRHPSVKDRVLEALASNSRWQTTMISSAARRPLADRLILRLLELAESSPELASGEAVTPKISQSTLASMVGVSRENINRALAVLATDGAIRQEAGRYVLVDEERLRREISRDWPLAGRRDRRVD